ncbi:MAG: Gfo/Idh/MocA family oxidoreductase [Candidatus Latescibacteria bacterium]|nr:Gfo/Idh/MocA family oxidoreductase [Candidatus Latescibacterota bacterium]
MGDSVQWGILSTGSIARSFVKGLEAVPDAEPVAVGSRTQRAADAFGDEFGIPRRHPNYAALANDPDVDVIYVATPHSLHKENSILCLKAGKPVLCEKPFTINRSEAEEIVAVAREAGLFLMEAMWTRFLPIMYQVRQWIQDGAIGEVRMVSADFGFGSTPGRTKSRLYDPALGGGALMDVGIYSLSFASMVFRRPPSRVMSMAHIGELEVDEQAGMMLGYDAGEMAMLFTSIQCGTTHWAHIMGTGGVIRIHPPYWRGTTATLVRDGKETVAERPYDGNGYNCQAEAVGRYLREGKLESDEIPLDETVAIMGTMDMIRDQIGLKFPME